MLKIERPTSDDGGVGPASRYTLKGDPYSSHSAILDWLRDRTHLRFFTRRSLAALVTGAGLRVARMTATPVPLYQVVPPRWHGRALAAVHALSAGTARVLPRLFAYQFVVLAKRAPTADRP